MMFPAWFQKVFCAIALKIGPEAQKVRKAVYRPSLNPSHWLLLSMWAQLGAHGTNIHRLVVIVGLTSLVHML